MYVEVRSGTDSCENRNEAIGNQLEILGATVASRLTKDVTHVVSKRTYRTDIMLYMYVCIGVFIS